MGTVVAGRGRSWVGLANAAPRGPCLYRQSRRRPGRAWRAARGEVAGGVASLGGRPGTGCKPLSRPQWAPWGLGACALRTRAAAPTLTWPAQERGRVAWRAASAPQRADLETAPHSFGEGERGSPLHPPLVPQGGTRRRRR